MQILRESIALAQARRDWAGSRLALVPTMGALHPGHMALVGQARTLADVVVATIFVNPLQFGAGEDLDHYPRQEEADLALLEAHGCDAVWLPTAADIYPDGFATTISVGGVSERWDGAARPGHFDGVATVVAKLLIATLPQVAIFGEKDFQQLAVIRRMVSDLGLPVEIIGAATVRDADGLALSSRNAYLSLDERARAVALPQALSAARDEIQAGQSITDALAKARATLAAAGFDPVDYVALVDPVTLEPLENSFGDMRLIAAARIGSTRLIDNIRVVTDTVSATGSPPR